ncbi:F-box only protein 38 like protein [Argiope bruennichi]|uniref:F-box only protein 38 like protein n=1 Tax=Argiope bruennichi TaxID=94029 RepID=A0A8T0EKY2_ARGBR|nr:F-box only protein 38 like protein [Argiope bruennichi]
MIDKNAPILTDLSHELICHILQYLSLQDVLSVSLLCKKLLDAVSMHLRLCKSIDFCEGKIYGYMPSSITDDHMHCLFDKCPNLEIVYGLHPLKVERRRLRKRSALTVPGIIEALSLCHNLKSIETSDLRLLEAIMQHLPQIKIIGHFQNRDGVFPPQASHRLKLFHYPRISSLHLIGVEVPELTSMPHLEHLHLQCVRFTKLQPFRAFLAIRLKTFVMKHCMGPTLSLRYLSLIIALSSAPNLTRLELVRVPLPGGLFQRAVEDSYRHSGFVNLKTLVISGCKGVMEADLGHLMIVASKNLERVFIQPSLTRDSLFVSLSFAQCEFPKLKDIHLGYVDKLDFTGQMQGWEELTDLTLQRCHCLQLLTFAEFLEHLPNIEVVILNDMFREPPKGCSHVGLSAGTGLGMSSAVVSNQDEHIAVQGHQQDFELQADDHVENEEMDRDFIDVIENEENPDQHIMVLQQEFFDEENHVAPAAVIQRENVDPENRIENMAQEVPENRIRRELNEDYDGYMNENNAEDDGYDPKYMLFDQFVSSSSDEDDQPKPSKMSRKVGTDSYDFQTIGAANNSCCSESSKYPLAEHKSSPVLPDGKENVDSDDKKCSNNQSQDKSSRNKSDNSYVKKCAHSKICTNKCSKGFDPNQPSTSRDGNCLDCSCVDSDAEMKDTGINVKIELESDDENFRLRYPVLQPSTQKIKYYDKRNCDTMMPDEVPFKGPLTRNRKKILHQKIKKEPTLLEPPANRGESFNAQNRFHIPLENKYFIPEDAPGFIGNMPIKTEPVDDGYENPLNNQEAIIRPQFINPPEENINDVHDKQRTRKHKLRHKGRSSTENPFNNQNINKKHRRRNPSEENVSKAYDKLRAKKHKKHKHKKSKKSSKHSRPSRKKGPITRSRTSRHLHEGREVVSQGTQATSADIRRSLRRQRNCSLRCKKKSNSICGSSHRKSHNHISARQQMKRPKQTNPNVEVQNKSTSTSDPLMEDDAVQMLRLVSESLISLTIISCGISDLFIDECLSLRHVEVQACRILKMLQIGSSPYLERFNVSQCPKLSLEVVVNETLDLVTQGKLLVCFEPCMQVYYPSDTEKIIFSKAAQDINIVLYQDFTSPANEIVQAIAKENLLAWTDITDKMYESPVYQSFHKHWLVKERKNRKKRIKMFLEKTIRVFPLPLSNDSDCGKDGKYQILTNDHLFTSLLENKSWDKGFPAPEACDECAEDNFYVFPDGLKVS